MPSSDPLLQPLQIKKLTLKNRIFSSAHVSSMTDDNMPAERYQAYHEEKAKGGVGLTMFGGSSVVSADSHPYFGQIDISDDHVIPYFQEFADRIHRHGAALMCQLIHLGRGTAYDQEPGLSMVAPSVGRDVRDITVGREMDRWDIKRIISDYGKAARRCREGGLDGCELTFGSHLIGQFLNPYTNLRQDGYGGALKNRLRFGLEVLEAVRRECGPDFIVGIRMYGDERNSEGLHQEECLEIAEYYAKTGLIDFLSIVVSQTNTYAGLADMMPGMARAIGLYLPVAAAFKRAVDIPVFHATRIPDLATARNAIDEGIIDLVGMTRAHLADPHIVAKLVNGEEDRIRPCVGATYCSDFRYGSMRCLHNVATGRETWLSHDVTPSKGKKKKVVVVGAGPGGMEAARVAALRGHDVLVFEAADKVGGQNILAARVSWRKDMIGITDWLANEIERLGVTVRFNVFAEPDDILAEDPDVVIVATGGVPASLDIEGSELATNTWEVLERPVISGDEVLIVDYQGEHQAPTCAEHLVENGAKVEFVTIERTVGEHRMRAVSFAPHLQKMFGAGVTLTPSHQLLSIARHENRLRAVIRHEYTGATAERLVDRVVVENGTVPVDGLFHALRDRARNYGVLDIDALKENRPQDTILNPAGEFFLFRVGDAMASRNIHSAIYDARRICNDL